MPPNDKKLMDEISAALKAKGINVETSYDIDPSQIKWDSEPIDESKIAWDSATPKRQEPKSVSGFISNVGRDIGETATGLYNMAAHPVDTLAGLRDYIAGAGGELRKGLGMAENPYLTPEGRVRAAAVFAPTKEAISKSVDNPLGIPGRMLNYAYEKPITTSLMASQGLGMAAKGTSLAGMPVTTNVLRAAETATNPIALAGKAVTSAPVSRVLKETVGAMTGAGPGYVEQAVKGSKDFSAAMRGKITGEEIVDNARSALQTLRDARGDAYRSNLQMVKANPTSMAQIKNGLNAEMQRLMAPDEFRIGMNTTPMGNVIFDFSNSPLVKNVDVVKKALQDITTWSDDTPAGLDILKKRLSKYIDQTERQSPAEAFLTRLESNLNNGLKRNVPQYAEMTKGYAEATKLIKDIESNLMLRREGMTGRITADNTLRRLSSALRENFEMRKDLLETLGSQSGIDVAAQVAGFAGSQWIPRGGLAKLGVGGSIYFMHLFNPNLWPILAASSPRVMGEFLNSFGKAAHSTVGKAAGKVITSEGAKLTAIAGGVTGREE